MDQDFDCDGMCFEQHQGNVESFKLCLRECRSKNEERRKLRGASKYVDYDDPVCVCGVYKSEHALCGCERFQTPESYQSMKDWFANMSEDEYEAISDYMDNGGIIY